MADNRARCGKCRRFFASEKTGSRQWCPTCEPIASHAAASQRGMRAQAIPDYAAEAMRLVERYAGLPCAKWGERASELHRMVNRILRAWAIERGVSEESITPRENQPRSVRVAGPVGSCPGCQEGRAGANGGICRDCKRRADNAASTVSRRARRAA